MEWQEFCKEYLQFNRKERMGILVLSILALVTFLFPRLIQGIVKPQKQVADTAWLQWVSQLEKQQNISTRKEDADTEDATISELAFERPLHRFQPGKAEKTALFYFDPNTLSQKEWEKLGLKDKTIQTIQRYLSKGGRFRIPEDLQKIYGLSPEMYNRLAPYIRIMEGDHKPGEVFSTNSSSESRYSKKVSFSFLPVDINSSDTSAFISLPGIGSKLAARIINFREKLGGFYSIDQVAETYGLSDSVFQKIKSYLKLEHPLVKKININTATLDELKMHPYFKYSLAYPIVAYRNEHGFFSKVEDIKKVMVITEEIFKKIEPYLTTQ